MKDDLLTSSIEVTIDDVVRDVRRYLQHVQSGQTVVISEAGRPIAELKPVSSESVSQRPYGLAAGRFTVPSTFNDSLPTTVLNDFEGA